MPEPRLVVLISGRGSNLAALLAAGLPVVAVLSNHANASGLVLAREHGIATDVVPHHEFPDRATFDTAMRERIDHFNPSLVVLAGYMRILTDGFVQQYHGRLINIHPSLLPSYPGLHTHARALADGVKVHGCTVHFVTPTLDNGPIIIQAALPVLPNDTVSSLAERVLHAEHLIYPRAVTWLITRRLVLDTQGKVNLLESDGVEQSVWLSDH